MESEAASGLPSVDEEDDDAEHGEPEADEHLRGATAVGKVDPSPYRLDDADSDHYPRKDVAQ